jgi:hypothetical protein
MFDFTQAEILSFLVMFVVIYGLGFAMVKKMGRDWCAASFYTLRQRFCGLLGLSVEPFRRVHLVGSGYLALWWQSSCQ